MRSRRQTEQSVTDQIGRIALTQLFENVVPVSAGPATGAYASITAVAGTAGPINIFAPTLTSRSPRDGFFFAVIDADGGAATKPITISGAGKLINGQVSITLNTAFSGAILFYSIALGEWVAFEFGAAAATAPIVLARGWNDNAGIVILPSATPTIVVSKSITPTATGKIRVTITGVVENNGETGSNATLNVGISHGVAATPEDYVQAPGFGIFVPATATGAQPLAFALTVDLDAIAIVFPLATPVQINASLTATSNPLTIRPHACELSLQELSP